jgi:hypothetical protein
MVNALRMARQWLVPSGWIVDLHPTAAIATIHVGGVDAGPVDQGGAPARHQAATDAIATAIGDRLLTLEDALEFEFWRHADTLEALDAYIREHWRDSRIGSATLARARELQHQLNTSVVSVRERVAATRLRP